MPQESNAQQVTQEVWIEALQRSAARNAPVELQRLSPDGRDEFAPMLKSRMLGFDQTQLVIEEPTGDAAADMIKPGSPLMLYIAEGDDRWEFATQTLESAPFALNASVRVQGAAAGGADGGEQGPAARFLPCGHRGRGRSARANHRGHSPHAGRR